MLPTTADIVIIGGGCMGVSTAHYLAERGAGKVVLLEREKFMGMGSTGRNAGGVRYQFSTEVNVRLSMFSLDVISHFEELFGISACYHPIGYLFLLTTPREIAVFKANVALQQRVGVPWVRYLEPREIARLVPLVNLDGVIGGTFCPRDGLADPNSITQGFAKGARARGAQIEMETTVTGIQTERGRVAAVVTDRGEIATRTIVNCAGPWAAQIGALAGLDIPIVPVRRQFFTTDALPQIPRDHAFVIEFATSLYFHPEGAGLLVGMSNPDEKPGESCAIDEEFHCQTLERAMARLPLLESACVASQIAGLYEVTPDAHPILAQARALPGFYIAAGFSGHGFQHSPATGKVMSELILDGKATTIDISMLDLERFAEGRLVQEVNVV
ncbi:MAG: FAD-binding oxidoreductase [Anaerolineales bacterium]|nr:FAD-binding oxidoreductase [Anaerolineales bacterium]